MGEIGDELKFQQKFACGWCIKYATNKHDLIVHHNSMYRHRHLAFEFTKKISTSNKYEMEQHLAFDQYFMYYCGHCNDSTVYVDATDVYNHWINNHDFDTKPFQFTVAQLAQCHYCNAISTFEGLKKHHSKEHSTSRIFAIENLFEQSKCGLCLADSAGNLRKHFKKNYSNVFKMNFFSPIPLSNDILKELTDIEGQKKLKCRYCNAIFLIENDFFSHHAKCHGPLKLDSEMVYDNHSVQLIAGCCDVILEINELFNHLKEHKILSKSQKNYLFLIYVLPDKRRSTM